MVENISKPLILFLPCEYGYEAFLNHNGTQLVYYGVWYVDVCSDT